jgi:hypothetical protein
MNRPRIEVREGVIHFVFESTTGEHAFPCTHEGATEFVLELAGKLEDLKHNPDLMKTLGAKAVSALVDLFAKRKT